MPKRIIEDHKIYIDIIKGKIHKELKKLMKGSVLKVPHKKKGYIDIRIDGIDNPIFIHGFNGKGTARGEGKPGDKIGKDPRYSNKGDGDGEGKPGDQHEDGVVVEIDMETVLKFMQEELNLPNMQHKPSEIYEEFERKYNSISNTGPESLRHMKRTLLQAIKRSSITGEADQLTKAPGESIAIPTISIIQEDKRFRQYREKKLPVSNAVIFFARDYSGSMSPDKCEVVRNMSWWIDCYISAFYEKIHKCYILHDTNAREVNEKEFYETSYGGGTICSSAFNLIGNKIETVYSPNEYNIYVLYFSDGENWNDDNNRVIDIIKEKLNPNIVNMIGYTEIFPYGNGDYNLMNMLKESIKDNTFKDDFLRITKIDKSASSSESSTEEATMNAIKFILGKERKFQ